MEDLNSFKKEQTVEIKKNVQSLEGQTRDLKAQIQELTESKSELT